MIILDIETTGLDPQKNAMVSLGAVDYDTDKSFYGECRIEEGDEVNDGALAINGFTREQINDIDKVYAVTIYEQFLNWTQQFKDKLLGGHNIGHFDLLFLERYHRELHKIRETLWPFGYRTVDLHTVAYDVLGKSLSHEKICEALGLPVEQKPHNALTGARSERDAFQMLFVHNPAHGKRVQDIFKGCLSEK